MNQKTGYGLDPQFLCEFCVLNPLASYHNRIGCLFTEVINQRNYEQINVVMSLSCKISSDLRFVDTCKGRRQRLLLATRK